MTGTSFGSTTVIQILLDPLGLISAITSVQLYVHYSWTIHVYTVYSSIAWRSQ